MTERKRTTEIDLGSQFFEEHVEFLTKITVEKLEDGRFKVYYPQNFESKRKFVKHFAYLCWFWFMTSTMDKLKEARSGSVPYYAR